MAVKKLALETHDFPAGRKGALMLESQGNARRKIDIGEGAAAEIALVNFADPEKDATLDTVIVVGKNASLKLLNCNFGGRETRSNVKIEQKRGSRCEHVEIALLTDNQRLICRTGHLHSAKGSYSRSSFRYAAAKSSQIDSEGKVTLSGKAKGADAHFAAKSLLLSKDAVVKLTPMLYVWNNEVAAGHGAAMAPVSEEELFYLNARGIDDAEGKRMILRGFLAEPAASAKMNGELVARAMIALERKMSEMEGI